MRVSLEYVVGRIEAEGLDRVFVFTKGAGGALGHKIASAEGTQAAVDLLSTLPGQVAGDMVVKAWKHRPELRKPNTADLAYHWTVSGTMAVTGAGGYAGTGGGPSWREYLDLKLELARREMEAKYADKENDGFNMRDLAPVLQGLVMRLGAPSQPVAVAPAPVASTGGGASDDPELRSILADVVRFYRNNPEQARQFAPMLRDMANQQRTHEA